MKGGEHYQFMDNTIYVTMFQKFSFSYRDKVIDSDTIKSDKLIKLFGYLLMNTNRAVPSSELIDFLWFYEEIDNPIGALKNLVYRLRAILKKQFLLNNFIVTGKGAYSINSEYIIKTDVSEFEYYNDLIIDDQDDHLENYDHLIEKYKGKFLTEIKGDHNILSKSTYYHSIFIDRIIEYADILEEKQEYEKMEAIARQAISIDNLEEDVYEILIKSVYFQHQYKKAHELYKSTTDMLYQTLGIKPSESLLELYDLIKKEDHEEGTDISDVKHELIEEKPDGAFLCEYGTFREIYTMQSRMIGRLGICSHLCLITLIDNSKSPEERENNKALHEKNMQKIQQALLSGLRIGDVISRLSINQYVVLLPACNYENSLHVIDRVLRKIRYSLSHTPFLINLSIEEVLPKES